MCFLAAKVMVETIDIDGDVGGEVNFTIIDKNGARELNKKSVETFMCGKAEYERNKITEEKRILDELVSE